MNKTWICNYASGNVVISCPTSSAPYGHSTAGGSGLNDAGFQNMSKQSTEQGRAKKPDKSAPGGTPDEQAPAVRTPDAPNMDVLLATVLAKIDEKFEALRSEQSAPAPTTAGPSSQPDEQPVSRHRAAKRRRSSPPLDRVVNSSDSEYTDSDSPAEEIEMRTHRKTKRHGSTSGTTASDMGWAKIGDEVTGKLRQGIYSNEYFPLRILRTDHDLDPQEDPAALTLDRKRAVIPVDQIGEWLHLFMTYTPIRAERYPEEGSQLMTCMDHILTMHAQKGPRVWLEYDYRFRVRRERTDTPWNLFNYPLYSSVKAKCKAKQQTHLSAICFRKHLTAPFPFLFLKLSKVRL